MGYLDQTAYDKLVAKRKTAPIGFSVDSLPDKRDRTLTLGKNQNGAALHVFIKDRVLHAHEYVEFPDGDYFTVTWRSGTISPATLNPSFYAIPLATDEEFAELMLRFSHPLEFAEWNSGANMIDPLVSGYFGRIFRNE